MQEETASPQDGEWGFTEEGRGPEGEQSGAKRLGGSSGEDCKISLKKHLQTASCVCVCVCISVSFYLSPSLTHLPLIFSHHSVS